MVTLRQMSDPEFDRFREQSIPRYANEMVRAGQWEAEGANELGRKLFSELLPDGKHTAGHTFLSIVADDSNPVGYLWYGIRRDSPTDAFLWELFVAPEKRRRGYATAALVALERDLSSLGCRTLSLHVFAHNDAARALYEKCEFECSEPERMNKRIG